MAKRSTRYRLRWMKKKKKTKLTHKRMVDYTLQTIHVVLNEGWRNHFVPHICSTYLHIVCSVYSNEKYTQRHSTPMKTNRSIWTPNNICGEFYRISDGCRFGTTFVWLAQVKCIWSNHWDAFTMCNMTGDNWTNYL